MGAWGHTRESAPRGDARGGVVRAERVRPVALRLLAAAALLSMLGTGLTRAAHAQEPYVGPQPDRLGLSAPVSEAGTLLLLRSRKLRQDTHLTPLQAWSGDGEVAA